MSFQKTISPQLYKQNRSSSANHYYTSSDHFIILFHCLWLVWTNQVLTSRWHDSYVLVSSGNTQSPGAESARECNNSHNWVCTWITNPVLLIEISLELVGCLGANLSQVAGSMHESYWLVIHSYFDWRKMQFRTGNGVTTNFQGETFLKAKHPLKQKQCPNDRIISKEHYSFSSPPPFSVTPVRFIVPWESKACSSGKSIHFDSLQLFELKFVCREREEKDDLHHEEEKNCAYVVPRSMNAWIALSQWKFKVFWLV